MAFFRRKRKPSKPEAAGPQVMAAAAAEPDHTLRAFGEALAALDARIGDMGALVIRMVEQSAHVFLERNAAAAEALIREDLDVDTQKDALLAQALEVLARHQPVATDLRLLLAIEHIARDLERSADHAKNIAKRTLALSNGAATDPTLASLIQSLHAEVTAMLADALRAFRTRDVTLATELSARDLEPDRINDDLFHAVLARIRANPAEAPNDIQALFVGKALERIGDHATNIADEARFLARGDVPRATRTH